MVVSDITYIMSKIQLKHGAEELPQVPGPSPDLGCA